MADGAIREIHKHLYLSNFWTDLHQMWFPEIFAIRVTGDQIALFKNHHGGGRHLEFPIFGHISVVNKDIFVKFGTLIDIGHTMVTIAQYIPPLIKLKMVAAAILDFCFCTIAW